MSEKFLYIGAHADDLEFSVAGTVAQLTRSGITVDEILMTDSQGDKGTDQRQVRKQEAEKGACILGVENVYHIGLENEYKDSELHKHPIETLIPAVIKIINDASEKGNPYTGIISFSEHGYTGHPDHIAVYKTAKAVFEMFDSFKEFWQVDMSPEERKLWGKYFIPIPEVDVSGHKKVDISGTFDLKIESLYAHESQVSNGADKHIQRLRRNEKAEYFKIVKKPHGQ